MITPININQINNNIKMKKILIIIVLLSISTLNLYSQDKKIKGRVISEFFETMPGVSIIINDTVNVGKTDLNGYFQIDMPISVKKILFESVGLEPTTIELINNCDEIEVIVLLSGSYDFVTPKKADRLRIKKFKKLPKLHKEAFDKSIFNTDKTCYLQEFISYCKKKQK